MISELYKDYGTVCYTICTYLSHKNNSTISQIHQGNNQINLSLIYQGLSLLIQRNIVSYYKLDSTYYYKFLGNRRLFFNLYLSYIKNKYDLTNYKFFFTILLSGTYKLNNTNIEIYKDDFIINLSSINNIKRTKTNLFTVNYEKLDKSLLDLYIIKLVNTRYSKSMSEIYKSVCKCQIITIKEVLNNLESSSILIKDGISYINEINNIEEYLKYLINFQVIKKDIENDKYVQGDSKLLLRNEEMSKLFVEEYRIFNLFKDLKILKDSDVSKFCLMKNFKEKMFKLMKFKIIFTEGGDTWKFNEKFHFKMVQTLDLEIEKRLKKVNQLYSEGSVIENEEFMVYVCEITHLSYLYFIFN
ncbi:DNA-directed RNA polymerase III subunit RPC3 [Vairimorpha necatrix]|uniref:DNA-directed RNA polymerase III subunit RPC3 n=1 Tax=Vairimorpha necatrix TaxID=6039 RepID=A0AAX4JA93_9MICR